MSSLVEDALTDEEQAMINMMKMVGHRIEWVQYEDGDFELKLYAPNKERHQIKTKAPDIGTAVKDMFMAWNRIHNG